MTLFKQILIGSVLFIFIILGIVAIKDYKTSNDFIQTQLQINAEHTAKSLGLSISTLSEITPDSVGLLINAIFDSGVYEQIKFLDANSNIIYDRKLEEHAYYGVSKWFIDLVDFTPPSVEFEIRQWNKIGTLIVQISPVFAYEQLYTTLKDLFISLGIICALSLIFVFFALKALFRPLELVRQQAEAILENIFIVQDKLPFTQEVKKMVQAMNSMVGKVRDIFEREAGTIDRYNELLYKDERTNLYNRRYFINQYEQNLNSEEYSNGFLFVLSIKETYNVKKILGFAKALNFFNELAAVLKTYEKENVFILNENDFAILSKNRQEFKRECINVIELVKELFEKYNLDSSEFKVNAALAYFDKIKYNELLVRIDHLLLRAKNNFSIEENIAENELLLGKQEYKDFILNAMNNDEFCFVQQDVLSNVELLHSELYLRLKLNGELMSASFFMPIVSALNINEELDMYVLSKAISNEFYVPIAINISNDLIKEKNYKLLQKILKNKNVNQKIYFELAMNSLINISDLVAFVKFIKQFNISLGLDHFALNKEYLLALNELNVSYLKIQASMLLDLLEDNNTSGAKNAMQTIINSKGVKIIAIGIENSEQKEKLQKIGIEYMQGRYISEIK
ncbi:bifunctional diguanylate cyclase/phosphodiesterase [Campylobacter canadensis]|uniref:EAL domain-containing protein n=1 Tax=Campylobacter canadensis TaxID=449520 RepID=A0ABS7WRP1_9BACT|nr:EAL domain-containing protein [Campylobacter canadensis]MBZ7986619.1 EAL domain-containing protein [Campylobacter canadensis]MBZ7997655.1 EAL domain-containing protein [Campylobacter canadensis]